MKILDDLYFWLFRQAAQFQNPKSKIAAFFWRRLVVVLQIKKHLARKNWAEVERYVWFFLGRYKIVRLLNHMRQILGF